VAAPSDTASDMARVLIWVVAAGVVVRGLVAWSRGDATVRDDNGRLRPLAAATAAFALLVRDRLARVGDRRQGARPAVAALVVKATPG
jgi:hypothetical protein